MHQMSLRENSMRCIIDSGLENRQRNVAARECCFQYDVASNSQINVGTDWDFHATNEANQFHPKRYVRKDLLLGNYK
jgi:hypothetical protein